MSTQSLHKIAGHDEGTHVHRIGSVARLSGVSVSTLRMWESRYEAFSPAKSEGQHRLYSEGDVVRARLLRELTQAGHSIGRIAAAPMEQLQRMLTEARGAVHPKAIGAVHARLRVAIVGGGLAARINAPGWARRLGGAVLDVRSVHLTLDEACADESPAGSGADMLLVRVNALQPGTVERLVALKERIRARHAMLLYNFGAQAATSGLRAAGFLLRREPIDDAEFAELLRSVTWAPASADAAETPTAAVPSRVFSESDLARIATSPVAMLCECPRHLVDIITQLASFEEYSAQCLNDSEEDAAVHAQLRSVAGSARALFEGALELVIAHERMRTGG